MKTIFNKTLIYGAFAALLAASCTSDNEKAGADDNRVAVRISAGVQTRVENSVWNAGDAIGISMIDPKDGSILSPYMNYDYITTGDGNFSPAQSGKIIYFPASGKEVSFKAYYPFSAGTPSSQVIPVSVSSQTSLADIDLMTAEHLTGTSIDDPNVKLHFYHRLAKIMVNLSTDDTGLIDLEGCKLTVKGLKTKASYDLMKEALTAEDASIADINVPIHNAKGEAIWLPRAAAEGVVFEVTTAEGITYTARMDADLELKAGYKHTFNIRLKSTPVVVSATIEEWLEGPERKTDVIRVVTGLKDSENVKEGDTLRLFLKDQADYAYAAKFTYGADGKWTTPTPIYWDDITADPAHFIGTTVIDAKLNDTQMDDILISKEAAVDPFTGVNLELGHAGAKAIVELKSTDNSFSKAELESAVITFPGYKYTGKVNEKGEFVINDGTKDIVAKDGIAIFPPQTIKKGDVIAKVTIGGRDYEIKADDENFDFEKGVAKKLIADMSKTEVKISTKIVPWTEEEHIFSDVRIGSANLAANGGDLVNGDELYIYTGTNADRTQQDGHFTYNSTTNSWNYSDANNPLLWEDMPVDGNIYASITRPAISGNSANNQLPDYITATPITNDGGSSNTAINFEMKHSVAKVIVELKSSSFGINELKNATVTLPSYKTGATMDKGVFTPGTTTADITLPNLQGTGNSSVSDAAYLQPQDIAKSNTVVSVTLNGRTYNASKNEVIKYEAGKVTTLIIILEKSSIAVSASVEPWDKKPAVEFDEFLDFNAGTSSADGFTNGDKITMYKMAENKVTQSNNTYTYSNSKITATSLWFRNDFTTGDKISAVYPNSPVVSNGSDSFEWTADGSNDHDKDVLVATDGEIKDATAQVDLEFKHVLSKVTVNVCAGEGFTTTELSGCTAVLKSLVKEGSVNIATGAATVKSEGTADEITPSSTKLNSVEDKTVAASFAAFVMPQTINSGGNNDYTFIQVTIDGKIYDAKITSSTTFEGGKEHIYNITFAKTGLSLNATVTDWVKGTGGDITIN